MARKTLLFLSSDNFQAYTWCNGVLTRLASYANNDAGMQAFSSLLQTRRDPAYILVDLIEEDFRHELVPHLTGSNHNELLQRKFDQYYRNTPFRLARRQRRQEEGRRDDEMLFSALTNPARISSWLEILLDRKIPLAGIYSLPHATVPLVKQLEYDQLLLLSWEKDAGLRQSYYFNNRLRFSRLTPLPPISTFADAVTIETARTYQYLQSLSLTPHGELLKVHIICHASERSLLDERLSGNKYMVYSYLDIQQLGVRFKSHYSYQDSDATPLFLHLLATQPPRGNYARSEHTHYYQLWQTRRGLFGLAAVTALACLVWSALSLWEGNEALSEADIYKNQAQHMQRETEQITQKLTRETSISLPASRASQVPASDMKTVVTLMRSLQHYSEPPEKILAGLTATLNNFPRIRTDKLSWQIGPPSSQGMNSNFPVQVITYQGELLDFGNNYRNALDYLELFHLALRNAGYTVSPLKMPLDFSPQGSISPDIGANSDKQTEFSLKIIWRQKE